MSQKDSLSKLKNFFRMDKNASGKLLKWNWLQLSKHSLNLYGFRHTGSSREKTDADLLRELEVLLQPQVATAQRCKTLKELCESDKINRLADVSGLFIFFYSTEEYCSKQLINDLTFFSPVYLGD